MQDFRVYLLAMRVTTPKAVDFYLQWVRQFHRFNRMQIGEMVSQEAVETYLKHLSQKHEAWQVDQAARAIKLYQFHEKRKQAAATHHNLGNDAQWKTVADDMRKMLRLMHRSHRTEKTYLGWVRRLYRFLDGQSPHRLDSSHVKDFMTHLAVEQKVSASTQNQAFNAILFLFRHPLDKDIEGIADAVRARRTKRLPVVLTRSEISRLFEKMRGTNLLMARMIYGCGLRLAECVNLRIKDIDFEREAVTVRSGKGDKDRETVLPASLVKDLKMHLEKVRSVYDSDREYDSPGVMLPAALERKYPNAGKEWAWFYLSYKQSIDPKTGIVRQHHVHHSNLQKAIKAAGKQAGISKRITVHNNWFM